MALSENVEKKVAPVPEAPAAAAGAQAPGVLANQAGQGGAPVWIVPAYISGLVFVYLGERVLSGMEKGAWVITAFGLALVMFSTALRFAPQFRARGDRRRIENMMAILSVIGVVALALYFCTTEGGMAKLGLDKLAEEKRERTLGILQVAWSGLLVMSVVPMVFAQTALYPMRNAERPESRRIRAAAIAGLSLAAAAIYGALFVFSAANVDLRVDYSYFKTSRPSDSTKKIVESLTDNIKITAFFPQVNDVKTEVSGYLSELAAGNKKLKVDVKDRLLVPKLARDLRANQDGVIVLTKDDVNKTLVIGTNIEEARAKLKTLDRDFQEQLLKLARSRRTAYFTVGHGELNDTKNPSGQAGRGASVVRMVLQKQNYTIRDLGIAQGLANEIPDDAEIVMILGPTEPFAPEELSTLKRYRERGGKLFIALDPDAISTAPAEAGLEGMDLGGGKTPGPEPRAVPEPGRDGKTADKKPDDAKPGDKSTKDDGHGHGKKPGDKKPEPAKKDEPKPAEPPASDNPRVIGLSKLAEVAGLEFSADILANDKQHVRRRFNDSDKVMLYTTSFSSHASVSTLSRNAPRAAIITYGSGSLKRAPGDEKVDFAVRAMSGTFPDKNRDFKQDTDSEKSGVFQLGAAVSKSLDKDAAKKKADKKNKDKPDPKDAKKDDKKGKKKDEDKKPPPNEFRAFVLADSDAISDWIMERAQGNVVMFVDAVRWLGGEESWAGEVNTEEDVRIEHTKQEDLAWFYASIFGAPALVLAGGLVISQRSRRKRVSRRAGGKKS